MPGAIHLLQDGAKAGNAQNGGNEAPSSQKHGRFCLVVLWPAWQGQNGGSQGSHVAGVAGGVVLSLLAQFYVPGRSKKMQRWPRLPWRPRLAWACLMSLVCFSEPEMQIVDEVACMVFLTGEAGAGQG